MITPKFFIFSIILIAGINLLTPFTSKEDSFVRNFLLILTSTFFFITILITDWLFFKGIVVNSSILSFGNYTIAFHLEPLGLIFLNLIAFLWICSLMYTTKYLTTNNIKNSNSFLFFLNICVLCGILVAMSANLFTMFICYEVLTLTTIPLIIHQQNAIVDKTLCKYFNILMISGLVLFLPVIIIIYAKIGHGDFIYEGFIENNFSRKQTIILLLMFIFGISKATLYPLHGWLPVAMIASYPVSALLHAVIVVKTGLFCIYKVLMYIFGLQYLQSVFIDFNWIIFFPILTIFYSSFKAISTNNIKMILAYSTINQLSIALLSAFIFTPKAMTAALLHMISHSFSKISLFHSAGIFYTAKDTYLINDLYGIAQEMPKTSIILLVSIFSLIGVPPFGGFISKFYIMLAATEQKQIFIIITLALSTLFSAMYMSKILLLVYKPFVRSLISNTRVPRMNIEKTIPTFMLISIYLCGIVMVLFVVVNIFIKQFIVYL